MRYASLGTFQMFAGSQQKGGNPHATRALMQRLRLKARVCVCPLLFVIVIARNIIVNRQRQI